MAKRSLKSLYFGFAAIERQLLKMEHTGWVHYKQENGDLELRKSPYRPTPLEDNIKYAIPLGPAENELVLCNGSFKFYGLPYDKDHGKKETAQC